MIFSNQTTTTEQSKPSLSQLDLLRLRQKRLQSALGRALNSYTLIGSWDDKTGGLSTSHLEFQEEVKKSLSVFERALQQNETRYRQVNKALNAYLTIHNLLDDLAQAITTLNQRLQELLDTLESPLVASDKQIIMSIQAAFNEVLDLQTPGLADKQEVLARHLLKVKLDELRQQLNIAAPPTVFISYSWDNAALSQRVHRLAKDLKRVGLHIILDIWHNRCGSVMAFIEHINQVDIVLVIGTPGLVAKWNNYASSPQAKQQAHHSEETRRLNIVPLEIEKIAQRFIRPQANKYKVVNVLLAGEHHDSFPSILSYNSSSFFTISKPGMVHYYTPLFELLTECLPNKQAIQEATQTLQVEYQRLYQATRPSEIDQLYQSYLTGKTSQTMVLATLVSQTVVPFTALNPYQATEGLIQTAVESTCLVWQLPTWNPQFIERRTPLGVLKEKLVGQSVAVISEPYSITGLGGVGKTQLAVAYAHAAKNQGLYGAIIWFAAEMDLDTQYQRLAREQFGMDEHNIETEQLVAMVITRLAELQTLVIFDNAEDYEKLKPYLPADNTQVIITSRNQLWGNYQTLELSVFTEHEALAYIEQLYSRASEQEAKRLAETLGYFPLALSQALAYIVESVTTLERYLSLYYQQQITLLKKPNFPTDPHQGTVYQTLELTLQALQAHKDKTTAEAALQVIYYASYLLPDAIPRSLLSTLLNDDEILLDDAIRLLRRYSLITATSTTVDLHRLVQKVVQYRLELLPDTENKIRTALIEVLTQALPTSEDDLFIRNKESLTMQHLWPQALQVAKQWPKNAAALWYRLGVYTCCFLGKYDEAKLYLQQAKEQSKHLSSGEHLVIELIFNYMLCWQDKPRTAIQELRQFAERTEQGAPALAATAWEYVSEFSRADGQLNEALQYYQTAIQHYKQLCVDNPTAQDFYAFKQARLHFYFEEYQLAQQAIDNAIVQNSSNALYQHLKGLIVSELPDVSKNAIAHFTQAIKLNPGQARLYTEHGDAYVKLNKYSEALRDYTNAIELEPDNIDFHNNRGTIYYYLGQYQKALSDFTKLIELKPNYAKYHCMRGDIYRDLNQYQEALVDYARSIELNPLMIWHPSTRLDKNLTDLDQYKTILANCAELIKFAPNNAWQYKRRGDIYLKLKQYKEAITDYTTVIKLEPNKTQHHKERGDIYRDSKQYPQALADYTKAIELEPNISWHYIQRADFYCDLKQYKEALTDCKNAILCAPDNPWHYKKKGDIYRNLEKYQKALAYYTEAIRLNIYVADFYSNRGQVYFLIEDYKEALNDSNNAIELDPRDAYLYDDRGLVYYKQGHMQQALDDHTKAIELEPNSAESYRLRGQVYTALGYYDQAIEDCKQSISKDSNNLFYKRDLAWVYVLQGDTLEATLLYEQIIACIDNSQTALHIKQCAKLGIALCQSLIQAQPWPKEIIEHIWTLISLHYIKVYICQRLIEFMLAHAPKLRQQAEPAILHTQALLERTYDSNVPSKLAEQLFQIRKQLQDTTSHPQAKSRDTYQQQVSNTQTFFAEKSTNLQTKRSPMSDLASDLSGFTQLPGNEEPSDFSEMTDNNSTSCRLM